VSHLLRVFLDFPSLLAAIASAVDDDRCNANSRWRWSHFTLFNWRKV